MESPRIRQASLYNRTPTRLHGWKIRSAQNTPQSWSANPAVMRWDGVSKSSKAWNSLKRDPELWFRDGDCYVYLHGEGQSCRGPSFKIPYSAILEAKCQPLVDRFISKTHSKTNRADEDENDDTSDYLSDLTKNRIELFIPALPDSNNEDPYEYHLATRNLFAFICQRAIVGEHLGDALIFLMHSLDKFRTSGTNNIQDMMNYIHKKGYSNLNGQPAHSLAMLRLAEDIRDRDLYINAFAHCCGIGDQLLTIPEYQLVSSVTSELIQRVRLEMHIRLARASTMLKGFLYDEVCEINIELGPGARGHFERFRALLRELYAAYFDYYPALANDSRTPVLTVETFRTIRTDFEALYQFLVDETFDVSQIHRHQSESTMHILESIRSFDRRYHCETLIRPLPLVPYTPRRKSPVWKTSWWNRSARTNHLWQADISAIILSGAANWHRRDVAKNQLVSAYRKFEGRQPASLTKADKLDKIGPVDGRKIRWILIYAIYQILRQATEVAAEVRNTAGVPYHLCISTTSLPPWKQVAPSHTTGHSPLYESSLSTSPFSSCSFQTKSDDGGFLFPDQNIRITGQRRGKMSSWKTNFANSVSRKSSKLRRSLSLFRNRETGHHSRAAQRDCREASVYRHGNGVSPTADDKELATGVISGDPVHPLSYMFIGSSASVNSNVLGYGNSPKSVTFAAPDATVSRNMGRSQSLKYECHDAKRRSAPDLRLEMPSPQAPTAWDHIQTVMEGEASNYEFGDQEELDRPTSLRPPIKARPKRTTTAPTYRRASMLY